jgi:prolipoprotein diacylglyceryltransferase
MWVIVRKLRVKKGFAVGAYLTGYGAIRFVLEYLREPDAGMNFPLAFGDPTAPNYLLVSLLNFTTGQIFCAFMLVAGITIMALRRPGGNQ